MSLQRLDFKILDSILKASILSCLQFKVWDSEPKFDTYMDLPKIMGFSEKKGVGRCRFLMLQLFRIGHADNPRWKFREEFYHGKQGTEHFQSFPHVKCHPQRLLNYSRAPLQKSRKKSGLQRQSLTFSQASHIGYISFFRTSHIFHLKAMHCDGSDQIPSRQSFTSRKKGLTRWCELGSAVNDLACFNTKRLKTTKCFVGTCQSRFTWVRRNDLVST